MLKYTFVSSSLLSKVKNIRYYRTPKDNTELYSISEIMHKFIAIDNQIKNTHIILEQTNKNAEDNKKLLENHLLIINNQTKFTNYLLEKIHKDIQNLTEKTNKNEEDIKKVFEEDIKKVFEEDINKIFENNKSTFNLYTFFNYFAVFATTLGISQFIF